jgi:DNA-binding CsgD family transcriptional regulator
MTDRQMRFDGHHEHTPGPPARDLSEEECARIMTSCGVTTKEVQVLKGLMAERTVESIAREMGIAPRTVSKHIENMHAKLGVHTAAGLVARVLGTLIPSHSGSAELRIVQSANRCMLKGVDSKKHAS